MHKNIILVTAVLLGLNCSAQKTATISDYNGTYNSPTNLFKNNNYIRVYFFNDSIFLFTLIEGYNPPKYGEINAENKWLRFNGHSFFGIARLVDYKGVKSWIGVSDFFSSYKEPRDPDYLSLKSRVDFNIIIKAIENPNAYGDSEFEYNVYQFFLQKNKISMKGISGVTRFFEIGDYQKVDNSEMIFGIDSNDDYFKDWHNNIYHDNTDVAIVKELGYSFPVPISEKIPENKPIASFMKGDKVYMTGRDFMKYTFVVQFDKDYKITKYGWIIRNLLEKATIK
jgi:hypothetical protein